MANQSGVNDRLALDALAAARAGLDIVRDIEAGIVYAPGSVLSALSRHYLNFRESVGPDLFVPDRAPAMRGEYGWWWLDEDGSAYCVATVGVSELLLLGTGGRVARDVREVTNGAVGVSYRIPNIAAAPSPLSGVLAQKAPRPVENAETEKMKE